MRASYTVLISSAEMLPRCPLCLLDVAWVPSGALKGQLPAGPRVRARAGRAVPGHAGGVLLRQAAAVLVVLGGAAGLAQLHGAARQALQGGDEAGDGPLPCITLGVDLPVSTAQGGQAGASYLQPGCCLLLSHGSRLLGALQSIA